MVLFGSVWFACARCSGSARAVWVVVVLALCLAGASHAEPVESKLVPAAGMYSPSFGSAVAGSGDVAFVGAPADGQGATYVFRRRFGLWVADARLEAPNPTRDKRYGAVLAAEGDLLVVAVPEHLGTGRRSGTAYVYRAVGSGWIQEAQLRGHDTAGDDFFGIPKISEGRIAISACNNLGRGAVYVFGWTGTRWAQEAKLVHPEPLLARRFGCAIAFDGDVLVASSTRGVLVFREGPAGWVLEEMLYRPGGLQANVFGDDLAVEDDVLLISSRQGNNEIHRSGAVYAYRHEGANWRHTQKLIAPDGATYDDFGLSIDLDGGRALIGARFHDHAGSKGAAYLFEHDGTEWNLLRELVASDPEADDRFGWDVALMGDDAFVGAGDSFTGNAKAYAYSSLRPSPISLDVRPGVAINRVSPGSPGLLPVAILGDAAGPVADVDRSTLTFGPKGASPIHEERGHLDDVNGDGLLDLVSHYRTQETGIALGDSEACVSGRTTGGEPLRGCDAISPTAGCGDGFRLALILVPAVLIRRVIVRSSPA